MSEVPFWIHSLPNDSLKKEKISISHDMSMGNSDSYRKINSKTNHRTGTKFIEFPFSIHCLADCVFVVCVTTQYALHSQYTTNRVQCSVCVVCSLLYLSLTLLYVIRFHHTHHTRIGSAHGMPCMLTNENDCLSLLKLLSTYCLMPYTNEMYKTTKSTTKITKENERLSVHSDSVWAMRLWV